MRHWTGFSLAAMVGTATVAGAAQLVACSHSAATFGAPDATGNDATGDDGATHDAATVDAGTSGTDASDAALPTCESGVWQQGAFFCGWEFTTVSDVHGIYTSVNNGTGLGPEYCACAAGDQCASMGGGSGGTNCACQPIADCGTTPVAASASIACGDGGIFGTGTNGSQVVTVTADFYCACPAGTNCVADASAGELSCR